MWREISVFLARFQNGWFFCSMYNTATWYVILRTFFFQVFVFQSVSSAVRLFVTQQWSLIRQRLQYFFLICSELLGWILSVLLYTQPKCLDAHFFLAVVQFEKNECKRNSESPVVSTCLYNYVMLSWCAFFLDVDMQIVKRRKKLYVSSTFNWKKWT